MPEPSPTPVHYTPEHFAERIRAEHAAMEARGEPAGERKTVTALFADMAGSTALIHDLDPEVAHRLIVPVVELMMEAVHYFHERTAQAIEVLFPTRIADYCSELAHHYSQSGNVPKAVEYLHRAAHQALRHAAHQDAMHHLGAALALLKGLPDTPMRAHWELTLLLSLGPVLMDVRGYGATEVGATYTRALALCERTALGMLEDAMAIVEHSGEHCYEAELYRLTGIYLAEGASKDGPAAACDDKAADCFHRAIARARRQGARALELRAASDLARQLQRQGKPVEARQVLSDVYACFTEGFDTGDLREAKALLDALDARTG